MAAEHNVVREGIIAGILSATVIVVWLFIVDAIASHPFFTPMVLGRGLLGFFGRSSPADSSALYVVIYTIFHYVAFAIIGIIAAMVVHQARRTPAILAGFLIAFVVFEIGFYGLAALLSVSTALGGLAWYQIGVANLVAAVVMFYFMWARHPELKRNFTTALEGRDV
jgi:hypothetical protein